MCILLSMLKISSNSFFLTNFSYGACYYSYLHCDLNASNIWQRCFSENPLSRISGEKFQKEILAPGGAKDPQEMIDNMVGKERVWWNWAQ